MQKEFAFAFIKPDGMREGYPEKIKNMLTADGRLVIIAEAEFVISLEKAIAHYDKNDEWCRRIGTKRHDRLSKTIGTSKTPVELGREILRAIQESITTHAVRGFILTGPSANAVLREIVGDTDPALAKPGTIRHLSADSFKLAEEEMRPVRNIIHASESAKDARREILNMWPDLSVLMQFLLF